jgi:hypothetical protein
MTMAAFNFQGAAGGKESHEGKFASDGPTHVESYGNSLN